MLRGVMRGETPISPAVAGKLLNEFRKRPWHEPSETAGWDLIARELEVLQLVAEGLGNAEIAARLFIVEGTVKNHLHNILEKLHSRTGSRLLPTPSAKDSWSRLASSPRPHNSGPAAGISQATLQIRPFP
jgi:DNA-binding NarL/FixJ family response regulator